MHNLMPDSVWKHEKSGLYYQIIMFANMLSERHDDFPHTVVYRRIVDDSIWSRPVSKWHASFVFVSPRLDVDNDAAAS